MPETIEPLYTKEQTVSGIFKLVSSYKDDLKFCLIEDIDGFTAKLSNLSLEQFFTFVKKIPYKRDDEPIEVIARPRRIIEMYLAGKGKDCKKAAILIGSFLSLNGFKWRLATVSTRADKKIHHIFPQMLLNDTWVNVDATYPSMKLFEIKTVTKAEYFYD